MLLKKQYPKIGGSRAGTHCSIVSKIPISSESFEQKKKI